MVFNLQHKPELAGTLTAYDFDCGPVIISFEENDGWCVFVNAFFRKEAEFVVIYTEHVGYHVFLNGSIDYITGPSKE